MSHRLAWGALLLAVTACQIHEVAPLAGRSLTVMGKDTEVRMRQGVLSSLATSDVLDLATQRVVDDQQVTGHVSFELDVNQANPTLTVVGQQIDGRTVKFRSLGAVDYSTVALDTIPTDTGMNVRTAGVKVNDVLLFKATDTHAGQEFGKLVIRKATSVVVGFDYTLNTDGQNDRYVCPTPSPQIITVTVTPSPN